MNNGGAGGGGGGKGAGQAMRPRKLLREELLNYFPVRFFGPRGRHVRDGILCLECKTLSCIPSRGRTAGEEWGGMGNSLPL